MKTEMYRFETALYVIRATVKPSCDPDLSWDDTGETRAALESGLMEAFDTTVTVETKDGYVLGSDTLGESIYANPREFFSDHRSADPMNRNCIAMREANGQDVVMTVSYAILWKQQLSLQRQAWRAVAAQKVHGHIGYTDDPAQALTIERGGTAAADRIIRQIRAHYGEHQELTVVTADSGRLAKILAISWRIERDLARQAVLGIAGDSQ